MIHYHGGPITPKPSAVALWTRRHAFVSFDNQRDVELAAEICQTFALDNGAFSLWKRGGGRLNVKEYVEWVDAWRRHPGFDFCVIPDVIDGTEYDNDVMVAEFRAAGGDLFGSVPVWHMHESLERLVRLCNSYRRVALGSSGEWSTVGSFGWWQRMGLAMDAICDEQGRPPCKLHGLRMLDPTIFSQLPLASADSTNVAQNVNIDQRWRHAYAPVTGGTRALVMADRIEHHASAPRWARTFGTQKNLDLVG